MDNKLKILVITAVVLIMGAVIAVVAASIGTNDNDGGVAQLSVDSFAYDFGTISMADGLARHIFTIKNDGTADLKLSNISTSCMCTTAFLNANGEKSPKFGMHNNPTFWSEELPPGEIANLEITYDPLFHGPDATGPITRTVTMYSNDNGKSGTEHKFTFTGNVVK